MSSYVSARQALRSSLEEELLRARELEAVGAKHLDVQEKRVAWLTAKKVRNPQSERLLNTMRETHKLQAGHVRLLEREVREASGK